MTTQQVILGGQPHPAMTLPSSPTASAPSPQLSILCEESIRHIALPNGFVLRGHDFAKLPKEKKDSYLSVLKALFGDSKVKDILQEKKFSEVEFAIDENGVFLCSGAEKILLSSFKEIGKKANKAFYQYYKELCSLQKFVAVVGLGERSFIPFEQVRRSDEILALFKRKQKEITDVSKEPAAWWQWAKPVVTTLADGSGGVRNAVAASSPAIAASTAITAMGVAGGCMGIASGALIAIAGQDALDKARKVEFQEGITHAQLFRGAGVGIVAMGAGFLTSKAASLAGNAAVAAPAMMLATLPLYIAWNGVLLAFAAYGFHHTNKFYKECLSYLDNPALSKDARLTSFLKFLKEELLVSPFEVMKLKAEVETKYPSLSPQEVEEKLKEEIGKKIEANRMRLEKRVGSECVQKIIANVDRILEGLQDPIRKEEAIKEAEKLSYEVRKETFKKLVVYATMIFLCILGIVAAVAAMVFTGPLPYVLFAIAGIIWMTMDTGALADATGNLGWKLRQKWYGEKDPSENPEPEKVLPQPAATTPSLVA